MVTAQSKFIESRNEAPLSSSYVNVVKPRPDDDLPSNVSEEDQLSILPEECLSNDNERPLRHVDDLGNVYHYALQPMMYSVIFILIVEVFERFSYYGVYYTQTLFLTGAYDENWNAGFGSVTASSFVSVSTAVAYTTPFVGAFLADYLGDYRSILYGCLVLYLPGLCLVALTTVPHLLGEKFNHTVLSIGVLILWPLGTGTVKSIVNVFGAKQFHPILQSSLIESYYVNFYMCINIGALAGITIVPIVAQKNVTVAYFWPVVMLAGAVILFAVGTPRYICTKPRRELFSRKALTNRESNISLATIFRISLLIVPFCVGYSQMPTTFIVQGTVMTKAFGFIDAATMNSADAMSVLIFGYLTGTHIYPALAKRGIKIPTTYKFATGSLLGALAIAWSLVVEDLIHKAYERDGSQICVMWQLPAYILIGWGEIFAVSAAYEVAFTASPPEKKVLASAVNIFCVGGLPNVLCIALYQACNQWFTSSRGNTNIQHIQDYATAKVANYFLVLLGILIFGIVVNTMPPVRDFVESVEEQAAELVKTPQLRKRPEKDEESPLLGRQQQFRKYGRGPILYKMGSMRAGPSLSQSHLPGAKAKTVKYKYIPSLYRSEPTLPKVATGPEGRPIKAGQMSPHHVKRVLRLEST